MAEMQREVIRRLTSISRHIRTVAYPGGFSGCPETPPPPGHDFFYIRGFTSLHAPTFTSHLNLRLLETPLETNSGYATVGPIKKAERAINECSLSVDSVYTDQWFYPGDRPREASYGFCLNMNTSFLPK